MRAADTVRLALMAFLLMQHQRLRPFESQSPDAAAKGSLANFDLLVSLQGIV